MKRIQNISISVNATGQCLRYFAAVLLFAVAGLQGFVGQASALQITSRSIEISNSAAAATNVSYQVGFTATSNATIQGIVVDFCDNDPIIGDATCTAPSGFSIGASPTVTTSGGSNTGLTGTWTAASANTNRTLELTNSTGTALNNTPVVFTLSGVTNPTTSNHSYYARILTYTTTGGATGYAPGSEGAYTDYGGIALSTASTITVSAKVMESISFCVYHATCGDDTSLSLGHGSNNVLDSTAVDTNNDSFSLSTNASLGVVVRLEGTTLTSGSNTIAAVNGGSATPSAMTLGTAAFGMDIPTPGAMTVNGTYIGTGTPSSNYGLDTTTANSITGTYGGTIASVTTPTNNDVTSFTFAATAANTTPAGIYTANMTLIATGTY